MLNQAKTIYFNKKLCYTKIKKLRSLFYDNSYPNRFFGKVLNMFRHPHSTQNDDVSASEKLILFDVPYVGKPFYRFCKDISRLILKASDVKVVPIYFKLKSLTPLTLVSNVVYRFTCSCNTGTDVCHPGIWSPGQGSI